MDARSPQEDGMTEKLLEESDEEDIQAQVDALVPSKEAETPGEGDPVKSDAIVPRREPEVGASKPNRSAVVINSQSHPDAYAWLNRSAKSSKAILPPEVLEEWEAGGSRRNQLLRSFVTKVYVPGSSQQTNILRLEAWNRIRQATKNFSRSFVGYAWHTEEELKEVLKWNEKLGLFLVYWIFRQKADINIHLKLKHAYHTYGINILYIYIYQVFIVFSKYRSKI